MQGMSFAGTLQEEAALDHKNTPPRHTAQRVGVCGRNKRQPGYLHADRSSTDHWRYSFTGGA
jgi:hypothetical protein